MNNIFTDTRLRSEIRQGLAKIGFTKPTPVQEKVIPAMLKGGYGEREDPRLLDPDFKRH